VLGVFGGVGVKDKSMQHLYAKRNSHNVPLKTISKMAYMFEW